MAPMVASFTIELNLFKKKDIIEIGKKCVVNTIVLDGKLNGSTFMLYLSQPRLKDSLSDISDSNSYTLTKWRKLY